MNAVINVLAVFGFLVLELLLVTAISVSRGIRRYKHEIGLPSFDSEPRQPARRGIPIWQLLLAIVLLHFTSDSEDDRHD